MLSTAKHRDLSLTPLPGGTLVVACDSCGAVGDKPDDVLRIPPRYTGRFTARVALMEVLAFGARPLTLVDAVSCEMEPTGRQIIQGIREELAAAGLDQALLTGSTEENFPTKMTALGLTVVGWLEGRPEIPPARAGDLVWCIGTPQVGTEVTLDHNDAIASYADLAALRQLEGLRELAPTGSHGIRWEADQLAACHGLQFCPDSGLSLELDRSTGPATCLVAVTDPACVGSVSRLKRAVKIGIMSPKA